MSTRAESEKQRQIQDKCQAILGNLLREEDNKYCVDCDAKGPRWASWNLGIFLCIRCAGIHRNLGVHISKVKSVNLDTWTPEQVACLQQMGNSQARAVYEANLPDSFRRPQTDSSLEAFIRAKYEQKKYIAKEWVPPPTPKPAFDLEEEKRKQKERKKSQRNSGNTVEIPILPQHPAALPRPHSAVQVQTSKTVKDAPENSTSQNQCPCTSDLLNLDISNSQPSDCIFDAFLSAPPSSNAVVSNSAAPSVDKENPSSSNNRTYDSTDLFTQMVSASTVHSNKMTKESILSLYGTASSQSQPSQNISSVYGLPGGMYVGQPSFSQMGIPRFSLPNQAVSNGITGVPHMTNVQQIQQQMSNLQLQGQNWNIAGVNLAQVPSAGIIINAEQPTVTLQWPAATHGQTLSTNLWQ